MTTGPTDSRPEEAAGTRPRALVVDDDPTNILYLRTLLTWEGIDVVAASDGVEAVARYEAEPPDIVFMDVMMPRMDGYEATRRIKALQGDSFVPVIFLTALSDETALAMCVDAGGDDFLTKPFSQTLLRAKLQSMARIRDLNRQVQRTNQDLLVMQAQRERDDEIAKRVFASALAGNSALLTTDRQWMRPASAFSGDILLTCDRPDGGLNLLVGDFTGHGLSAALGAIPVSEVFRAMTQKGFALHDILAQIHQKLSRLLPSGMFLSLAAVGMTHEEGEIEVWNGGMPDLLLVSGRDGRLLRRFPSEHLPLGIAVGGIDVGHCERIHVAPDDHLVLVSDGLIEARNMQGEEFGDERFCALVASGVRDDRLVATVQEAINGYCAGHLQDDDISLVDVPGALAFRPLADVVAPHASLSTVARAEDAPAAESAVQWCWSLELHAPALREHDPVPQVISQLLELPGFRAHQSSFFTVLTELYTNALNHGVLRLDSTIKSTQEGFDDFDRLRNERLGQMQEALIRIDLEYRQEEQGGQIRLHVTDSGPGFDAERYQQRWATEDARSGRGMTLVRQLCQSLRYHPPGNKAEAIFAWRGSA